MPVDRTAIAAQMELLTVLMKTCDSAQMALYDTVMTVEKKDPRFTATMRRYGILPQLSAFFKSFADVTSQMRPLLGALEEVAKEP